MSAFVVHDKRALEEARKMAMSDSLLEPPRQGQLILNRMGDAVTTPLHASTLPHGVTFMVLGPGRGQHKLFATSALVEGDILVLPEGGLVVHEPLGAYPMFWLDPGVWRSSLKTLRTKPQDAPFYDERAIEVANRDRESAIRVTRSACHGSLVFDRVGDAALAPFSAPTPPYGVTLMLCERHEYRLIASFAIIKDDTLILPEGGLVINIGEAPLDNPMLRHRTIRLEPGVWEFKRQRQLNFDGIMERVRE